jgi:Zn-dependent M28 family amino/carboxypeptidase
MRMKLALPALALCAACGAFAADLPQLDRAQLLDDVRTLASPAMEGRGAGSEGGAKARAYLIRRLHAAGVTPLGAAYEEPFSYGGGKSGVNLVGTIAGSDPEAKIIVLSAHYDHLGIRNGKMYPGADDNASGVAALLQAAAWFRTHQPRHTLLIALFDAEEAGLRGSEAFVMAPPLPLARLALDLNLDMVAHNDKEIYVAGTHFTPALRPVVEQAAGGAGIAVRFGHDLPGSGHDDWTQESDHGPFHKAGLPFLYFGVEDHPDYHKPTDTFEHINQAFFAQAAAVVVETAALLDRDLERVLK